MDGRTAIRIDGLVKRFGPVEAVRGLDLEVRSGEVFGFVGPNGAGKTTTIRCLLDLLRPTAGRCEVLGRDPRRDGPTIRGRIGYVPGELRLPDRVSARDLLASVGRLRAGLDPDVVSELIDRLEVDVDRRIRDLSTGNRRKVALLLAFAPKPDLLILDEPTSGLDPVMQHVFLELVREARSDGATVFLSSHLLSEVQRAADRLAVLRGGRLVALGSVDELRGRARQQVEVWFEDETSSVSVGALDGLTDVTVDGRRLSATLTGSIDPLIAALARHRVASLVIQEPDLEEAFLDLYAATTDAA